MILEKLTERDLDMLDGYREAYIYNEYHNPIHNNKREMSYILREWESSKQMLFKMFGGELILQKPLEYTKSFEELQDEIENLIYLSFGRKERSGGEFIRQYSDYVNEHYPAYAWRDKYSLEKEEIGRNLIKLIGSDSLISNKYTGPSFSIPTAQGKEIKIVTGCKVSRVLGKLAKIFDLNGYEDFRICHSQILNQKTLKGVMTISIHPMDYMTMSDNNCGWESCMSWMNEGCYRQGTVEMMNSPCVVVAYLTSDDEMEVPVPKNYAGEKMYWNNKKWRQLFIVDKKIITSVKSYPYCNDDLSKMVANWLKELATINLGWTYEDNILLYEHPQSIEIPSLKKEGYEEPVKIEFYTNYMYNDFGCSNHWAYISNDIHKSSLIKRTYSTDILVIDYSGKSECMFCGDIYPDFEDESDLACVNCQNTTRCDCCGELVDYTYSIDGQELCGDCWSNNVESCAICEEDHLRDNMTRIDIIPRISEEKKKEIFNQKLLKENREYVCNSNLDFLYICEEHALEEFKKELMIPSGKIQVRRVFYQAHGIWPEFYETKYYVYYDELTLEVRKRLNGNLNDDKYLNNAILWGQVEETELVKTI